MLPVLTDRDFVLIELERMRRYIIDAGSVENIDEPFLIRWIDDIDALLERMKETE